MYRVQLTQQAAGFIRGQTGKVQRQLVNKLKLLATEPRPQGCVKLKGTEDLYRLRLGDYRIIYQIQEEKILIVVVKIGHRREIYERLIRQGFVAGDNDPPRCSLKVYVKRQQK
jgi:mRNA interferase RelE/StbE